MSQHIRRLINAHPLLREGGSPERRHSEAQLRPDTDREVRRLKNGHPAHVFTNEDRRKAAAVTNEIRREKRALLEQLRLNREIERKLAADEARRQRRREKRQAARWIERGYGAT